jgi:hypothetical protein
VSINEHEQLNYLYSFREQLVAVQKSYKNVQMKITREKRARTEMITGAANGKTAINERQQLAHSLQALMKP